MITECIGRVEQNFRRTSGLSACLQISCPGELVASKMSSWEAILRDAIVVEGYGAATADVVPPNQMGGHTVALVRSMLGAILRYNWPVLVALIAAVAAADWWAHAGLSSWVFVPDAGPAGVLQGCLVVTILSAAAFFAVLAFRVVQRLRWGRFEWAVRTDLKTDSRFGLLLTVCPQLFACLN